MAGITDRPFRKLAEQFGAGMVVSEMIASNALAVGNQDMARKLGKPGTLPHMVQLAGCEAEWMARGARIAHDAGADIIDINFGCPAKRVTNGSEAEAADAIARELAFHVVFAAWLVREQLLVVDLALALGIDPVPLPSLLGGGGDA